MTEIMWVRFRIFIQLWAMHSLYVQPSCLRELSKTPRCRQQRISERYFQIIKGKLQSADLFLLPSFYRDINSKAMKRRHSRPTALEEELLFAHFTETPLIR